MEPNHPPAFDVLHTIEHLQTIRHPASVGDIINNRYRVLRRIGTGNHGLIWLVEDQKLNRLAALKILNTDASSVSCELTISRHLQLLQEKNNGVAHPGHGHVVKILDKFILEGPNGVHQCIVSELLGINMNTDRHRFYEDYYPGDVRRKAAAQVALAVSYLHQCGVIHGDLRLQNVLFYSPKLQSISSEEVNTLYSQPPYNNLDLFTFSSVDDIHIKICDFSASTLITETPTIDRPFVPYMPLVAAAPEVIFNNTAYPTISMDIWSLGVLLFTIINAKYTTFQTYNNLPEEVIESMVIYLGKLPEKWWKRWSEREESFDDEGRHLHESMQHCQAVGLLGIWAGLVKKGVFSDEEQETFTNVLRKIFRYDPEERIGADEVVRLIPPSWLGPRVLERFDMVGGDSFGSKLW